MRLAVQCLMPLPSHPRVEVGGLSEERGVVGVSQRQAAGVIDSDPDHLTVLLREKVARRPLPGRHCINAEDKRLVGRGAWPVEHGQERPSEGRYADLLA
jgi:hypothetical protein